MNENPPYQERILLVDDAPINLKMLHQVLHGRGFILYTAKNADDALRIAREERPDLILLDIVMPDKDGFEACRLLKADPEASRAAVIFMSSLAEIDTKVKGFEVGAVDYITKPFEAAEVLARVNIHLTIQRLQRNLVERNAELQSSFERLTKLEQLRDSLTHMVVHDLRNPLTGILGYAKILSVRADGMSKTQLDYVDQIKRFSQNMVEMVSGILDVNRLESDSLPLSLETVDLSELVRDASGLTDSQQGWDLQLELPERLDVECDPGLIRRVVTNLVSNGLKYGNHGKFLGVRVEHRAAGNVAWIGISDHGPGLRKELHARIFEKFAQVEEGSRHPYSTGLGLTFCKLVIEKHGGTIGLDSEVGQGTTFWFELPHELSPGGGT